MRAIIICKNGVEECEALITYDLLKRADIDVTLVSDEKEIISSHNLVFKTHANLTDVNLKDVDCLILPGGMPGTLNLENDKKVQEIIDYFVKENKYIAAICAAPSILIHKGLLNNKKFTCYPGFENDLVSTNDKCTQDNKFITAKGMGAAIEFGLKIIENLKGKETMEAIRNSIQY